jgi:hypothetical protein
MRKAWVYKRKKRSGQGYDWYLMWYDETMQGVFSASLKNL